MSTPDRRLLVDARPTVVIDQRQRYAPDPRPTVVDGVDARPTVVIDQRQRYDDATTTPDRRLLSNRRQRQHPTDA
jgi:hypothetical protein